MGKRFKINKQNPCNGILVKISFLMLSVLLLWVFTPVPNAHAATITVTTTADNLTVDGQCSLREAITAANTNTAVDTCTAGDPGLDTIILTAGNTYTIALAGGGEDANATGDYDILEPLTIQTTVTNGTATIDGADLDRIFHLPDGGSLTPSDTVTLIDLTIQNGTVNASSLDDGGGGINVKRGSLTLTRVTVANNEVIGDTSADGGGIQVDYDDNSTFGTITITDSTIDNNISIDQAGGIYLDPTSAGILTANITGSTISNNTSSNTGNDGGGIFLICASTPAVVDLTLSNSTISGNTSTNRGGGIFWTSVDCQVTISYSTIANNSATGVTGGGGIFAPAAGTNLDVFSSIIADNSIGGGLGPDCNGQINSSAGHNVIEDATACTQIGSTANNVTGTDPLLGVLADNGGPTFTHLPGVGSVAIDLIADTVAGCNAGVSTDQRGAVRAGGTGTTGSTMCDSGAVEGDSQFTPTAVTFQSFQTSTNSTLFIPVALVLILSLLTAGAFIRQRPQQ